MKSCWNSFTENRTQVQGRQNNNIESFQWIQYKKNEHGDNYQLSGPIKTDRTCLCRDLLFKNTPHVLFAAGFVEDC